MKRRLAGALTLAVALGWALAAPPQAIAAPLAFTLSRAYLNFSLDPARHSLAGTSSLTVEGAPGAPLLSLRLFSGLHVASVLLNGQPVAFSRDDETLNVELPLAQRSPFTLLISYAGSLRDASSDAIYLPPDGDWYPRLDRAPAHTTVRVQLPVGWRALSPAATQDQEGRIGHLAFAPGVAPALATGNYRSETAAGITCWTLKSAKADDSRPVDLRQDAPLLEFYRAHGLLSQLQGGQLVELPPYGTPLRGAHWYACQRPQGDLAYWIASAPWSSATKQDHYLVDSLIGYSVQLAQDVKGGAPPLARALKGYRELLGKWPQWDRPFTGDSKIIVNPVMMRKGALLWAGLHARLGDKDFLGFLRKLQSRMETGAVNWETVKAMLPEQADWLDSWLQQPGLPAFEFKDVSVTGDAGAYQVKGLLRQTGPRLDGPLSLTLVGLESTQRVSFERFDSAMPFHFVSGDRPVRLIITPPAQAPVRLRERLTLPVGLLAPDALIVYGTQGDAAETEANRQTAIALQKQLDGAFGRLDAVKSDAQLSSTERAQSLVLVGRPATNAIAGEVESQLPVRFSPGNALWWQGRTYDAPDQGVLEVIANPSAPQQTITLIAAPRPAALMGALGHKTEPFTFCIYDGEGVVEKGLALRPFPDLSYPLY